MRPITTILLGAALLAGCGGGSDPVGGVSAQEAAQLDNAAEMLDASADDMAAPPADAAENAAE